ncbi:hypothetical protein AALO_G00225740 [Alosa alosa]|uniref:AIG1-type G domain-containing protein n=1 Tax=Alosa alosa TaxID=278164 RepID=A0AAV6G2D6_9TELE|nr:hypothetical protein AALO_G00225740 [Alosa alosa]
MSYHVAVLGEAVWSHSLVLFITDKPLTESAFEVKGRVLRRLLEKCGERYHVLNTTDKDDSQVTDLLEKIDKMVIESRNRGTHFEMDREVLEAQKREKEKQKSQEVKAEERMKIVQRGPESSLKASESLEWLYDWFSG